MSNQATTRLFYITLLILFLLRNVAFVQAQAISYAIKKPKTEEIFPTEKLQERTQLISFLLAFSHYKHLTINDSLSELIHQSYLSALDESKLYFLEEDVQNFHAFRYNYDDFLREGQLEMPFMMYSFFLERFHQRMKKNYEILEKGFDFTIDEYFETDREGVSWAKNEEELDEVWRKYLKSQVLSIKLAGKSEKESVQIVKERLQTYQKNIQNADEEDVFQIFMNSVTGVFDPHTSYFSPASSDDFKIKMHKSLEGIGATLRSDNDYTKIVGLVPGGPAFNSKMLKVGDRIIAIGQGEHGEMVDVVGWKLDDVVEKIRGAKGTVVRLHVVSENAPIGTPPREVRLVRDKITLEEQSAEKKSFWVERGAKKYKIGVITIPSFYLDFDGMRKGDKNYKSTSKDVKKLIQELQKENIDGLIVDLRDNGGGALLEAVTLAGLFLPEGPIVQVKSANGEVEIFNDYDKTAFYNGPLVVLVNRFSASASEIFAAAMQDYKRAVIVGEQTYGKGTVQNVVDLGQYIDPGGQNQGHINMTFSKFYRVTGSSTQHHGVTPDICFPTLHSAEEFGESSEPNALPWDEISGVFFKPTQHITPKLLDQLHQNYLCRMESDLEMQQLIEEIRWEKELRHRKLISLHEQKFKEENERIRLKKEPSSNMYIQEIVPSYPLKHLNDPYLRNTIEILGDLILNKMG